MNDINKEIDERQNGDEEPDIATQTLELGRKLKQFSDNDPAGMPTDAAAAVFSLWLSVAGPVSREPGYFADVALHYPIQSNSNKDLFNLFDMLANYLDFEVEDTEDTPPSFIKLPMA